MFQHLITNMPPPNKIMKFQSLPNTPQNTTPNTTPNTPNEKKRKREWCNDTKPNKRQKIY